MKRFVVFRYDVVDGIERCCRVGEEFHSSREEAIRRARSDLEGNITIGPLMVAEICCKLTLKSCPTVIEETP
tara:strand:- start:33624 stop:33839 length:216 start_codon:yes stop_codon:yes gene_type:complete